MCKILTKIRLSTGNQDEFITTEKISKCPRCHFAISEHVLFARKIDAKCNKDTVIVVYQCNECFMPFIAIHQKESDNNTKPGSQYYQIIDIGPKGFKKQSFDIIETISKRFSDIFNQAVAAESSSLTEICGMAYGKALEFLIKDYLIYKYPEKREAIEDKMLVQCINDFVDDERIKATAQRCAWLRNDHTHYIAKHGDRDLGDLKNLLEATIYWVKMVLLTDQASEILPTHHG